MFTNYFLLISDKGREAKDQVKAEQGPLKSGRQSRVQDVLQSDLKAQG